MPAVRVRHLIAVAGAALAFVPLVSSPSLAASALTASATVDPRAPYDPSAPPERLTDFAARINKSMVTVYCGSSLGSGWASEIKLDEAAQASGYRSYIITNHHVIERCTSSSSRYIEVRQGSIKYPAYVYSWDSQNDLAALMTTADLPQLQWSRVPRPMPGQWVAAFGSPFGLAGSITTGIVSYVEDASLTSTAPINPGNSGGPLVDNKGRVLGVNTATLDGANGFGIVVGAPLLCEHVVNCYDPTTIWQDGPDPSATLVGERTANYQLTFYLSGQGIAYESATLYVKLEGETTYKVSARKTVPANETLEFTVGSYTKTYAYVEVAGTQTNRVIVAATPRIVNTKAPTISGIPRVGATLKAAPGSWSPKPDNLRYVWYVGTKRIGNRKTVVVPSDAKGQNIRLLVVAKKSGFLNSSLGASVRIR